MYCVYLVRNSKALHKSKYRIIKRNIFRRYLSKSLSDWGFFLGRERSSDDAELVWFVHAPSLRRVRGGHRGLLVLRRFQVFDIFPGPLTHELLLIPNSEKDNKFYETPMRMNRCFQNLDLKLVAIDIRNEILIFFCPKLLKNLQNSKTKPNSGVSGVF